MSRHQAVFKTYNQQQAMLLPPDLEELIDPHHPVRVINGVIDSLDIDRISRQYKGGGTSSYHPRMLLKVLVYAYVCNEYSSRRIEQLLTRDVQFMWLSGMSTPDHNTINRFRSERLKGVLKDVFTQIVLLLAQSGHIGLKDIYVDGTKIEANANRYTFVWGNAIKTSKEKMAGQLEQLWDYAQKVAAEELKDKRPSSFTQVDPEAVQKAISEINEALKDKPVDKKLRQKLNYAQKNWPSNLARYEQQEALLGERKSYSKTDPDATFMRMKEDHMGNGQLKPGYNVQVSTENQYVLNYTIHSSTVDTVTLGEHVQEFERQLQTVPECLTADAGYGSEQNYEILEQKGIEAYVKYNYFNQEQQGSRNAFAPDQWHYNDQEDYFVCPMGQHLSKVGSKRQKNRQGYEQTLTFYKARRCNGCPMRGICHKQKGDRVIEVNHNQRRLKEKAAERLRSEEGVRRRKKRCVDVEPVFANLKQNKGLRRFLLRGKQKVDIEIGLVTMAHNLQKMAKENIRRK